MSSFYILWDYFNFLDFFSLFFRVHRSLERLQVLQALQPHQKPAKQRPNRLLEAVSTHNTYSFQICLYELFVTAQFVRSIHFDILIKMQDES